MKLSILQLTSGDNYFSFNNSQDTWIQQLIQTFEKEGYKLGRSMNVEIHLTKLEPDYYLKGQMDFQVEQSCSRCAETFLLKLQHPFSLALIHLNKQKVAPYTTQEKEELDVIFLDGHEIDLEEIIREQFFLSLPYQSFCHPHCKGICQKCGNNFNVSTCECRQEEWFQPFSVLEKLKK